MNKIYLLLNILSMLLIHNMLIAQPTFVKDIKPIIGQKCLSCHNGKTSAPFTFNTYEDVKSRSATIKYVVENKLMPIWKPDPRFSHFENENYLTEEEINKIVAWCDAGTPKGAGKADFTPKDLVKHGFSKPDYVLKNKNPIILPAINEDIFGIVKIPFEFDEAFDVKSIVFKCGQEKLLHHVSIFILEKPEKEILDYTNGPEYFFLPPIDKDTLAGKVFNVYNYLNVLDKNIYEYWDIMRYKTHSQPGKSPANFPEGMGFKMPKKGVILLDMIHYLETPKQLIENISIEIYKQPKKVERYCISTSIGIGNPNSTGSPIIIMPNQQKWIESETLLPADMTLYELTPHMHLVGKQFIAIAVTPQKDTIPLINIPDWDMGWQETYRLNPFLKLPKGTNIVIGGYYDNTTQNIRNPNNPPKIIQQSMNKQDEMLLLMLNFFEDKEGDEKQKWK